MRRTALLALAAAVAFGCRSPAEEANPESARTAASSDEEKIRNAESAAPPGIARHATVMDWPAHMDGEPRQLRAGTNGWTCFPSTPEFAGASGEDPMCLDEEFAQWGNAWMSRQPVNVTALGLAYMLQGDRGASNTDPYATEPTPDNQWVQTPAHVMIVVPDSRLLEKLPTDPSGGGPYVMWKGTPYAHVMVPVNR